MIDKIVVKNDGFEDVHGIGPQAFQEASMYVTGMSPTKCTSR